MDIIRGVPALADTDPAALIGQYSRDLRAALLGPWVPLIPINGYQLIPTNPAEVMRFGPFVVARGGFTNTGTPLTTTGATVATIPTGYGPTGYEAHFVTMATLSTSGGRGTVMSSSIFMRTATGTSTVCEFPLGAFWYSEPPA